MNKTQIVVHYTDESIEEYDTLANAQTGIFETVTGCDFATLPDSVELVNESGKAIQVFGCKWSLELVKSF